MDTALLRNVGIVAHIDAGKTTTTERILFYTGKNYKLGEVDEGSATMDWMPQEQERGITITAAATTCHWKKENQDYQINIIDTPGHVDFTIEVERSLRVMDGAVLVIDGVAGVQPQTETVWRQANKFNVPRIVFINKLDRRGANFEKSFNDIKNKFKSNTVAVTIPFGIEDSLKGVINLIDSKVYINDDNDFGKIKEITDVPAEYKAEFEKWRNRLLDAASLFDDDLMQKILESKKITNDQLIGALRKGSLNRELVAVFAGASFKNKGVQLLIDGIVDYLPNPKEATKVIAKYKEENIAINCDENAAPLALVFKVQIDQFAGLLSYLKVYSGKFLSGKAYWNENKQKRERMLKIYRVHSSKKELIDEVVAGDIAAVVGLNDSMTGDSFTEKEKPYILESIYIPEPVIEIAIELKTGADSAGLNDYLAKLVREDPSLKFHKDQETGQLMLAGMGELHLEIALDRVKREAGLEVKIGKPQVAYRESPTIKAIASDIFDKPLLGKNCNASVEIELIPMDLSGKNKIAISKNLKLSQELEKLILEGCHEALYSGVLSGNPIINSVVSVTATESKNADTPFEAFKIAATLAVRKALVNANCKVLSPQMDLEIIVPTDNLGSVINDLNQRQARINSILDQENEKTIQAFAPLKNLIGYMTDLRSITQGKGLFTMEFNHFE